jgi:hypothetical protein
MNSGLPDDHIECIKIDQHGTKWIATSEGLAKFDSNIWTVYSTSNSMLPSNNVNCLFIDKFNNKWIGTDGGGIAVFNESGIVKIKPKKINQIIKDIVLYPNYPNPFNVSTTFMFEINKAADVTMKIFNNSGENVFTTTQQNLNSGLHKFYWNAINLPSGIYYYLIGTEDYHESRKCNLVK